MYILENVPLNAYSTMRLGGIASYLTEINDKLEIPQAIDWAAARQLPVIMIGNGSNIVWKDEGFNGLVLVNRIMGIEMINEDAENLYLTVGAGEKWDDVVARSVDLGYSGIEQLSLIPGTAGATPIQNVGAYGREIKDSLLSVEVFDKEQRTFINIQQVDCQFGYRTSRFKTTDKDRFFIAKITLHLTKIPPMPPFYKTIETYFKENNISDYTPKAIRKAVIAIRQGKLPDPSIIPNNGSFFANPIVDQDFFWQLKQDYPDIVSWQLPEGTVKISAGWLMEKAGLKGYHDKETGMAIWEKQALVLVNEHAERTEQLLSFKEKVINTIQQKFGITLEQEPQLLP